MAKIDINEIDDEELGKLIKYKLIKWQDIKEWEIGGKLNKKKKMKR